MTMEIVKKGAAGLDEPLPSRSAESHSLWGSLTHAGSEFSPWFVRYGTGKAGTCSDLGGTAV